MKGDQLIHRSGEPDTTSQIWETNERRQVKTENRRAGHHDWLLGRQRSGEPDTPPARVGNICTWRAGGGYKYLVRIVNLVS
jgi:hypothetical protein